ncbi:class I SAM-dependent methyltransferase [Halosolutus amylolyticus]|uniref:Class I SAM-dependent methyltransferase n=1 Tax=Halosolutus amylolyticus TaxID=2932267 RepID=A0ABD5PRC6_9EURY|nr:class I SAM-dependent methyltransferase [Halosolutus amylolyticus]
MPGENGAWTDDGRRPALGPEVGTPLAEAIVDDLPEGRALDLATGEGHVASLLADRGWDVHAVDVSRAMLDRARERRADRSESDGRPGSIDWILADVDSYCFPESVYDVVTIRFFDARDRLGAVKTALAPGGALVYEHHLQSNAAGRSGNQYRFEPNELLDACADLSVRYYAEDPDRSLVRLVAYADRES